MTTAGELADQIVDETARTDLRDQIIRCIQRVIREERAALHWFQDRRLARITLTPGQTWYGRFDELSAARLSDLSDDGLTRLYEDGGEPADDIPWDLEGADVAGGPVTDLLRLDDAQLIETGGDGHWHRLERLNIRRFNEIRNPADNSNQPEYICLNSGQIGFYPTPNEADIVRIFGNFLSFVPGEFDTSAMIDHAENFVSYRAKEYLFGTYLEDAEMSAINEIKADRALRKIKKSNRLRKSSGRLSSRL